MVCRARYTQGQRVRVLVTDHLGVVAMGILGLKLQRDVVQIELGLQIGFQGVAHGAWVGALFGNDMGVKGSAVFLHQPQVHMMDAGHAIDGLDALYDDVETLLRTNFDAAKAAMAENDAKLN